VEAWHVREICESRGLKSEKNAAAELVALATLGRPLRERRARCQRRMSEPAPVRVTVREDPGPYPCCDGALQQLIRITTRDFPLDSFQTASSPWSGSPSARAPVRPGAPAGGLARALSSSKGVRGPEDASRRRSESRETASYVLCS